jgi:hypothetical protein
VTPEPLPHATPDPTTPFAVQAVTTAMADVVAALAALQAVLPEAAARPASLARLARQLQLHAANLTAWREFLTQDARQTRHEESSGATPSL